MKHLLAGILVCVIWGLCSCQSDGKVIIPSPIYVDNHYHGPADPEITWNPKTEEWMIFYTSRRPFKDQSSYVGTPVGVAVSKGCVSFLDNTDAGLLLVQRFCTLEICGILLVRWCRRSAG